MLFLYSKHALHKDIGIAVDLHVHRILNRIGIVKTKSPEMTSKKLNNFILKDFDIEDLNLVLVGFGQKICSAKNPKCLECNVRKNCEYFLYHKL